MKKFIDYIFKSSRVYLTAIVIMIIVELNKFSNGTIYYGNLFFNLGLIFGYFLISFIIWSLIYLIFSRNQKPSEHYYG